MRWWRKDLKEGVRTEGVRGYQTSHTVTLQAPVSALHITRPVLWVLRPESGEASGWDFRAESGCGGALAPGPGAACMHGKADSREEALHSSQPHQARAQGSSASGPVPLTLPDLGTGFYTTDFIAFLYNSRLSELERPWRPTSICLHPFHRWVK